MFLCSLIYLFFVDKSQIYRFKADQNDLIKEGKVSGTVRGWLNCINYLICTLGSTPIKVELQEEVSSSQFPEIEVPDWKEPSTSKKSLYLLFFDILKMNYHQN